MTIVLIRKQSRITAERTDKTLGEMIRSPIKIAMSQYSILLERFVSTKDDGEKAILCRRLLNLLGVIQFLISVQEINSHIGPFV